MKDVRIIYTKEPDVKDKFVEAGAIVIRSDVGVDGFPIFALMVNLNQIDMYFDLKDKYVISDAFAL